VGTIKEKKEKANKCYNININKQWKGKEKLVCLIY
jgi:hypothetical protein